MERGRVNATAVASGNGEGSSGNSGGGKTRRGGDSVRVVAFTYTPEVKLWQRIAVTARVGEAETA